MLFNECYIACDNIYLLLVVFYFSKISCYLCDILCLDFSNQLFSGLNLDGNELHIVVQSRQGIFSFHDSLFKDDIH